MRAAAGTFRFYKGLSFPLACRRRFVSRGLRERARLPLACCWQASAVLPTASKRRWQWVPLSLSPVASTARQYNWQGGPSAPVRQPTRSCALADSVYANGRFVESRYDEKGARSCTCSLPPHSRTFCAEKLDCATPATRDFPFKYAHVRRSVRIKVHKVGRPNTRSSLFIRQWSCAALEQYGKLNSYPQPSNARSCEIDHLCSLLFYLAPNQHLSPASAISVKKYNQSAYSWITLSTYDERSSPKQSHKRKKS